MPRDFLCVFPASTRALFGWKRRERGKMWLFAGKFVKLQANESNRMGIFLFGAVGRGRQGRALGSGEVSVR